MSWLLDRDDELALLDRALAAAADGSGSTVLLTGEPGIGKTSLVREWCRRHGERARVLVGSCDDLTTPRPLGPFRDVARGHQGPLARALDTDAGHDRVFEALLAELDNPLRATVLVLEDLQYADQATLDAVRFLARRVGEARILLVLTARDDLPGEHPLRVLAGTLVGPTVHRLVLGGLSADAVAQLVTGTDGPSPERLHAVTGGNPFFLAEVLAAPGPEVPGSIRDAVAARIHEVPGPGRVALEQLAVEPGGLELHLVASTIDGGIAALADPERRGLVVIDAGRATFRHELTRRAVLAATPASHRSITHARLLAALDEEATDPARLVHHAAGAGDVARVARHAPAAARASAAVGAHRDAAATFATALRYPELLDPTERARTRTDHARELLLLNRLDEGLAEAEVAVASWEQLEDPEGLGIALTVLADARYWTLRGAEASDAATRAVELLRPAGPSRSLAQATSTLAFTLVMRNRFAEGLAAAHAAVEVAATVGSDDVTAHALTQRGTARVMLDDEAGVLDVDRALELARSIPHHEHVVTASVARVSAAFRAGRLREAEAAMIAGLDHALQHDLEVGVATLRMMRAGHDLGRGAWSVAEEGLLAAVGDGTATGWGETVAMALLGRLRARRGERGVDELLDRAWNLAAASGEIQRVGPVAASLLEWGWLTGRPDLVHDRVQRGIEVARASGHTWYLGELLRYRARQAASGPLVPDGATEVAEPWAAGLRGDHLGAAAAWASRGWPYEQALELSASDEPERVTEGLAILDQLGASVPATLVRQRLRAMGVTRIPRGPRATTREHPLGLTARQVEVLEQLAVGASNQQMADRLVLSVRTVEHHVSAVISKLGASSRRDAVVRAREEGLLDASFTGGPAADVTLAAPPVTPPRPVTPA